MNELDQMLQDYDINEQEFYKLPASAQQEITEKIYAAKDAYEQTGGFNTHKRQRVPEYDTVLEDLWKSTNYHKLDTPFNDGSFEGDPSRVEVTEDNQLDGSDAYDAEQTENYKQELRQRQEPVFQGIQNQLTRKESEGPKPMRELGQPIDVSKEKLWGTGYDYFSDPQVMGQYPQINKQFLKPKKLTKKPVKRGNTWAK